MSGIALIVGSGLLEFASAFEPVATPQARTASSYGAPSEPPRRGRVAGQDVLLLARHGTPHRIAPHLINYRANLDLLARLGAESVIALNTVGAIDAALAPGTVVVPHQLIDYTWGREQSFSTPEHLIHVDFTEPYDAGLRQQLLDAARVSGIAVADGGVYGCVQGPRFETAAEIDRMERDGCTLVGMTGMPEAGLARERGLRYAALALVVNPAAGRAEHAIDIPTIEAVSRAGMRDVERLLIALFERLELGETVDQ